MSIKILSIGKTRQQYLIDGIADFRSRLRKYIKVQLVELPDIKGKFSIIEQLKAMEADLLFRHIKDGDYLIVLDETGREFSSPQLAKKIEEVMRHNIVFVIGGVYGLDKEVLKRADLVLSFSRFTFTHQMIRLLLFEQLYRIFNILHGGQYHK